MYRTIRSIFHNGHLYQIGDKYTPTVQEVKEKSVDPRHFILDRDFSSEAVEDAAAEDIKVRKVNIKARKTAGE